MTRWRLREGDIGARKAALAELIGLVEVDDGEVRAAGEKVAQLSALLRANGAEQPVPSSQ